MARGSLCRGVENIVVSQGTIGRENLLARAAGSERLQYPLQPFPLFSWFHVGLNLQVTSPNWQHL